MDRTLRPRHSGVLATSGPATTTVGTASSAGTQRGPAGRGFAPGSSSWLPAASGPHAARYRPELGLSRLPSARGTLMRPKRPGHDRRLEAEVAAAGGWTLRSTRRRPLGAAAGAGRGVPNSRPSSRPWPPSRRAGRAPSQFPRAATARPTAPTASRSLGPRRSPGHSSSPTDGIGLLDFDTLGQPSRPRPGASSRHSVAAARWAGSTISSARGSSPPTSSDRDTRRRPRPCGRRRPGTRSSACSASPCKLQSSRLAVPARPIAPEEIDRDRPHAAPTSFRRRVAALGTMPHGSRRGDPKRWPPPWSRLPELIDGP